MRHASGNDAATVTYQTPRGRNLSDAVMHLLEGFGIGVGMWCMGFAVDLLPGLLRDTPGVLLFAVVGAVTNLTRARPALVILCGLYAAVIVIVSETSLSGALASRWVRADSLPAKVDAVVITSAGVNPNGTLNGAGLDHLLSGLELIRAGIADTLVSSTVGDDFPAGAVSSALDQSRVIALFGGHVAFLRTGLAESTRQEAVASANLLFPMKIIRIALVASPMHTRRACASFEAVGFKVTCVPARSRAPGGGWTPGRWPRDRLTVFGDWVYEILATGMYRRRGWLSQARVTSQHAEKTHRHFTVAQLPHMATAKRLATDRRYASSPSIAITCVIFSGSARGRLREVLSLLPTAYVKSHNSAGSRRDVQTTDNDSGPPSIHSSVLPERTDGSGDRQLSHPA